MYPGGNPYGNPYGGYGFGRSSRYGGYRPENQNEYPYGAGSNRQPGRLILNNTPSSREVQVTHGQDNFNEQTNPGNVSWDGPGYESESRRRQGFSEVNNIYKETRHLAIPPAGAADGNQLDDYLRAHPDRFPILTERLVWSGGRYFALNPNNFPQDPSTS